MAHPALAPLFDPHDHDAVAAIRDHLSPQRLDAYQARPAALYAADDWRTLGDLGLFRLGPPRTGTSSSRPGNPSGPDLARRVAMMADALEHDVRGELDLAIYVQGLVARQTLEYYSDRPAAQALLPDLRAGRTVFCTAYTDADPAAPVQASPVPGGFRLSGRKWLSVNMPHAHFALTTFGCGGDQLAAAIRLDDPGMCRRTLRQAAGSSVYSQGSVDFDGVFVADEAILSGGLRRLRVWNRVMSVSRTLNIASALRLLEHLVAVVVAQLAQRHVAGGPFHALPQFRRWVRSARAFAAVLHGALSATLRDIADDRIDEAAIAGLKALSVCRACAYAQEAQEMAGGAGTLHESEIARIAASLSHHKFSSGSEAQLMALYSTSLSRKIPRKWTAS